MYSEKNTPPFSSHFRDIITRRLGTVYHESRGRLRSKFSALDDNRDEGKVRWNCTYCIRETVLKGRVQAWHGCYLNARRGGIQGASLKRGGSIIDVVKVTARTPRYPGVSVTGCDRVLASYVSHSFEYTTLPPTTPVPRHLSRDQFFLPSPPSSFFCLLARDHLTRFP